MADEPPGTRRLGATLEGFPAWALTKYQKVTREGERGALTYIIKRWTELDETAKEHKITLQDFIGGGEVLPFRKGE